MGAWREQTFFKENAFFCYKLLIRRISENVDARHNYIKTDTLCHYTVRKVSVDMQNFLKEHMYYYFLVFTYRYLFYVWGSHTCPRVSSITFCTVFPVPSLINSGLMYITFIRFLQELLTNDNVNAPFKCSLDNTISSHYYFHIQLKLTDIIPTYYIKIIR